MIYVIQMRGTAHYKIGYTDGDSEERKKQLQTGNPLILDLVVTVEGDRILEKRIHHKYKKNISSGEWLVLRPEMLHKILSDDLGVSPKSFSIKHGDWSLTTTFKQWLSEQQARDDIVGDFARDVQTDKSSPEVRAGFRQWRNYLISHRACRGAREALITSWREFREDVKKSC